MKHILQTKKHASMNRKERIPAERGIAEGRMCE
jgi:hypothetical protein